jgi:hypothetical protein
MPRGPFVVLLREGAEQMMDPIFLTLGQAVGLCILAGTAVVYLVLRSL